MYTRKKKNGANQEQKGGGPQSGRIGMTAKVGDLASKKVFC